MTQESNNSIKVQVEGPFHANVVPEEWLRRRHVGRFMFGTDEVAALLGLNPRTLRHWLQRHLVAPDIDPGGRGSRRLFGTANLLEIAILDVLWKAGIGAEKARATLDALRTEGYFDRATQAQRKGEPIGVLLKDGTLVGLRREIKVEELLNCSQSTTWVYLPRVEARVLQALRTYDKEG